MQLLPHWPQLEVVVSDASQPLLTSASQLPEPALQEIEQLPRLQDGVPLLLLHTFEHVPQLVRLVCVLVSQPFVAMPSQLPHPELHVPRVHVPLVHDSEAFARSHTLPQAPQLARVFSEVSQPLLDRPSQSPKPALQLEMPQVPPTQLGVPPVGEHTLPQMPQLFTSLLVWVSQPLFGLPSQSE